MSIIKLKWWWSDIKYKYWKMPKCRKKMFGHIDCYSFDITDSIIEVMFSQFVVLWETWLQDKYSDEEYLEELKSHEKDMNTIWWFTVQQEMKKIYQYIKYIRPENKELYDNTTTEYYTYHVFYHEPCKDYPDYFELKSKDLEGKFNIIYNIDENDKLHIKKVSPSKETERNIHEIEDALDKLDDKYAHKLLDIRGYLWD